MIHIENFRFLHVLASMYEKDSELLYNGSAWVQEGPVLLCRNSDDAVRAIDPAMSLGKEMKGARRVLVW